MFARLAREPLVHFLLIGLLFFLLFAAVGGGGGGRSIKVDGAIVADLAARFQLTWQRPPTPEELRVLVESHVQDEIFYREGLELGLERDDPMIKRRVRQRVVALAEESGAASEVTDAELNTWLSAHPERYAEPALVTFQQVMVDPMKRGPSTGAALKAIQSELAAKRDPATLGDGQMLPPRVDLLPMDLVARDFGEGFAKALAAMKVGSWEGPVRSGYGIHLVRLERRLPGRKPALDEVRLAVARDWEADRRAKAADAYYQRLRKDYDVELTASLPPVAAKQ